MMEIQIRRQHLLIRLNLIFKWQSINGGPGFMQDAPINKGADAPTRALQWLLSRNSP